MGLWDRVSDCPLLLDISRKFWHRHCTLRSTVEGLNTVYSVGSRPSKPNVLDLAWSRGAAESIRCSKVCRSLQDHDTGAEYNSDHSVHRATPNNEGCQRPVDAPEALL